MFKRIVTTIVLLSALSLVSSSKASYWDTSTLQHSPGIPKDIQIPESGPDEIPTTQTVTLTAVADTFISQESPETNFETSNLLYVGMPSLGDLRRSLVRFDLSPIPPGASIQEASLKLYRAGGSPTPTWVDVSLSRIYSDWGEDQVTWNTQPGSLPLGITTPIGTTNKYYNWVVTGVVQDWIDGVSTAYGFMLLADPETTTGFRTFGSRLYGSYPPLLEVTFVGAFPDGDPQVAALRRLQADSSGPVWFRFNDGVPSYIHADLPTSPSISDPVQQAKTFLNNYKDLYLLSDPFQEFRLVKRDLDGEYSHIHLQQLYQGVPVYGGEIAVHLKGGRFVSSIGTYLPDLDVSTTPDLSYFQAEAAAIAHLQSRFPGSTAKPIGYTGLVIFDRSLFTSDLPEPHLAWRVGLQGSAGGWEYLVDAHTGETLLSFPHEMTDSMDLELFRARDDYSEDCWFFYGRYDLWFTEDGPEEDAPIDLEGWQTYFYTWETYEYYHDLGRHSYDDDNSQVEVFIKVDIEGQTGSSNARWSSNCELMEFSEGWVTRDILGHEFTHGVTRDEMSYLYAFEGGAVAESLSDTFGSFIEWRYDQFDPDWELGEDRASGAFRDMADPPRFDDTCEGETYNHPDHYNDYQENYPCDNTGVHFNAGIPNKAAWLIATTGENTHYGIPVVGLGLDIAEGIFYETVDHYFAFLLVFDSLRAGMIESTIYLYGDTSPELCSIRNAYGAVGIGSPDVDCDSVEDWVDEDNDNDGVVDADDNCGNVPNPNQEDLDGDHYGDACDNDADGDWRLDTEDNCPSIYNPSQLDWDFDHVGEACDDDEDGVVEYKDHIYNTLPNDDIWDNCRFHYNPYQEDTDLDLVGDACDGDDDDDGILDDGDSSGTPGDNYCTGGETTDCDDNAPLDWNPYQEDDDEDGVGDVVDNCLEDQNPYLYGIYPPEQADMDGDGEGDACDADMDGDGRLNPTDNCEFVYNPDQINLDGNEFGLKCDEEEAFMLSMGSHIFELVFPPEGPAVVPVFPCLGDGCPDPASTLPVGQVFSVLLELPDELPTRLLDEYGSPVRKGEEHTTDQFFTFEAHPAYHFDFESMNPMGPDKPSQTIDPLEYIQRPLYFLEIWPDPTYPSGYSIFVHFSMYSYNTLLHHLPVVIR